MRYTFNVTVTGAVSVTADDPAVAYERLLDALAAAVRSPLTEGGGQAAFDPAGIYLDDEPVTPA
jgi:hypothetical protein